MSTIPALVTVLLGCLTGCSNEPENVVVVYTSQDQVYSEPILREFTRKTGIEVRAVYDSETVKTVGLVNRLIAERGHPQCDVFWNNEALRTVQLTHAGVLRQENPWEKFGARKRQLVANTNQLGNPDCPRTLVALTNENCRGKIAIAYPMFGTTATHFLALRQSMGAEQWENWCRALAANKPLVVDGNSVVVKLVGRGEAWIGLTDTDDVLAGKREGLPVEGIPLEEHGLVIPNTVAIVRDAPHPQAAERLLQYLCSAEVVAKLVQAGAIEQFDREQTGDVDWARLLEQQDASMAALKSIFLR